MPSQQRRLPTGLSSELLVAARKGTWRETFTQPKRLSSTPTVPLRGLCPARARKGCPQASALRLCSPPLRYVLFRFAPKDGRSPSTCACYPPPSPGGIPAFLGNACPTRIYDLSPGEASLPLDNPQPLDKESLLMTFYRTFCSRRRRGQAIRVAYPLALLVLLPIAAHAQSPFDTGLTAMQTLFTSTVARATSLIAIVLGGYAFAHGEPGHKKTLAGVAAGSGIAVLATNVLTWLWGV
jgi:type IV secretory pathway VirB2 component (pilin)